MARKAAKRSKRKRRSASQVLGRHPRARKVRRNQTAVIHQGIYPAEA